MLQEFAFNRTRDPQFYETTVELLRCRKDERPSITKPIEAATTRTDERPTVARPTEFTATRIDERPTVATAKNVDVLEMINARADSLMKSFGVLRRDALRAAVKLVAQDTGRDLSPLLELLD